MTRNALLLVEDETVIRNAIARFFDRSGYSVQEADTCAAAEQAFRAARPDAAIVDFYLPDGDGLQLLAALRGIDASVPIIMLTGHGTIDMAVRAIKEGAEQFCTKPVELPALLVIVERLLDNQRQRQMNLAGRSRQARAAVDPFFGESAAMARLAEQARRVAASHSSVLIRGETGAGKGVLAEWLHRQSPRSGEAFVDLNCAGLSRDLLETELFGHEKGAFTGAVSAKVGLFEVAHRGTLFLDEIGDVDAAVQPKLLKVLEERRFRRLGDVRDRQVDVRLIAATHRDLQQLMDQQVFRSDLYYRIGAIPLTLPSLRERGDDVILLARRLVERIAAEMGRPGASLSGDAERALRAYHWPGNVRELRNVLERAVLLGTHAQIKAADLWDTPPGHAPDVRPTATTAAPTLARISLSEAERLHIATILQAESGNVVAAARILGLSRSALYQKLRKHNLTPSRSPSAHES